MTLRNEEKWKALDLSLEVALIQREKKNQRYHSVTETDSEQIETCKNKKTGGTDAEENPRNATVALELG
jgi:hypothetical protein